jgi:hypothetical protein
VRAGFTRLPYLKECDGLKWLRQHYSRSISAP